VAQAAKLHVYRLIFARQQVELAREVEKGLEENASLIQKAAARHNKTDIDLAAAEASRQQARAARLALERDVNTERLGLNVVLGLPPDQEVTLQDTINPALMMENHHPTSAAELLNTLEDHRLDLLALKTGYQSQEATLRAAIRSQFPKINLGFTRSRDTSDITTNGFGVTIDLPFFDRNQGQIALEKATRRQLFDEYVARVAEARAEVTRIVSDSESVRRQMDAAEETVPALERLVKAYEKALSTGNVDILSYYETRSNLATKRLEIIKLRKDLTDLSVALEIASGRSSITSAQEGS
jgi:Outer membrane protein